MRKFILGLCLSSFVGSLTAQEIETANTNKDTMLQSCPVPWKIGYKEVFVQPVKLKEIPNESEDDDRRKFKLEAYCDDELPITNDDDFIEPEEDDEDEDFELSGLQIQDDLEVDLEDEFSPYRPGALLLPASFMETNDSFFAVPQAFIRAGDLQVEEDVSEDQDSDWVVRPYFGIGLEYPLIISFPMGVYIEDEETTHGFILEFTPGIDGYKFGAGISTGFHKDEYYRYSLMLIVGKDGKWNEVDGESAWEDPDGASTFVGLQLMQGGVRQNTYVPPARLLMSVGYGVYIDGDQYEEGRDFSQSDLLLFQLGLVFQFR